MMSKIRHTDHSENLQLSTFYLGETLFGIDLLDIQEINKHGDVTRIPQAPDYIEGILNLRGRIVTLFDLGIKLGLQAVQRTKGNRNIIVDSQGEYIGLMVDAVNDIVVADTRDIKPAPSNMNGVQGQCFNGILRTETELIGILDINEILNEERVSM